MIIRIETNILFFKQDSWDSWDQAMKDVVNKWDTDLEGDNNSITNNNNTNNSSNTSRTTTTVSTVPATETRNTYRQIRSSNVSSDESQAVSCTEEDDKFKV